MPSRDSVARRTGIRGAANSVDAEAISRAEAANPCMWIGRYAGKTVATALAEG